MYYDELVRENRRLRKQISDANQRNRDLANEVFNLKTQITNLKLISPQGERLSSLLPADTKAWVEVESAINHYVRACGGAPQKEQPRAKKTRRAARSR